MEPLDGVSPTRIGKEVSMLSGELRQPLYVRPNDLQKLEDTLRNLLCLNWAFNISSAQKQDRSIRLLLQGQSD
jgi:hypothetical protein